MQNNEQYEINSTAVPALSFWADFGKGLSAAASGIQAAKVPVIIFLLLSLLDSLPFLKLPYFGLALSLMEEAAIVFIGYEVIRKVWRDLNSSNPDFKFENSQEKSVQPNMFAVCLLYGLYCFLFAFLFIVGGIWWGVRNSVAIVVAALEQRKANESFKRSEALVMGKFWMVFRYAFGGPLIVFLLLFALLSGLEAVLYSILPQAPISSCFTLATDIVFSFFQLVLFTLLVRLYSVLKHQSDLQPPVQQAGKI